MTVEVVVMGGGRMGEALLAGVLASGRLRPEAAAVVETDPRRREQLAGSGGLAGRYPGLTVTGDVAGSGTAGGFGAVIAVKPGDVPAACAALGPARPARVLSVAAGVTLAALEGWFEEGRAPALLRAMPNTPALVGAGAAALAAGPGAGEDDLAWAEGLLAAVGTVERVKEGLLDAVTGLSGSGPAYVFLVAEALTEAGVLVGLPRAVASSLVAQTILGAARMMTEGTEGPEALRAAVTSPGGTTAAGLRALEAGGVRAAVMDAVVAATERSKALGAG